jgi:hypothetical protein
MYDVSEFSSCMGSFNVKKNPRAGKRDIKRE